MGATRPIAPSRSLIWLIGLSIALNYIDRGAVSVAAPLIQSELKLSATGYGVIVSAFYWTYVPCLALAGWLADRGSVHRLMAAGVAVWALATAAIGLAGSVTVLIILRLMMGLGEGVAFPCGSKIIARTPEAGRGRANISLGLGIALGPFIGTLAGGFILARYGWRPMFIVFGLATLLWLVPWAGRRSEVDQPGAAQPLPTMSWLRLVQLPQLWAMTVLHICASHGIYFLIAWLPLWLVRVRGFDITDMALITGLFYLVQAVSGWVAAVVSDRMITQGRDASTIRKTLLLLCMAIATTAVLALPGTASTPLLIIWLVVASIGFGPLPNLLFTAGQTLAGPESAGRWVGLQAGVGNLSGVIGPVMVGMIVDAAGYAPAFWATAAIMVTGAIAFAAGVPRLKPIAA
ncbi:ACS family D-galactonate transporter-like MFS transporter [Polymorphobacter multimanifer]|uniref:ACS family D-galactonate transporter-like MFS transporter n=1 Tax=Polymorphobacter multimanifer TaxID=1070431 RepID=A0A841L1E6_9SPHN|nr:MFS transporter [Polymorphobacter multimanifer]MBB6226649.1 ACS family D-galactonate transporter-like MFS transporter [Polymorphobacter multimanifer]